MSQRVALLAAGVNGWTTAAYGVMADLVSSRRPAIDVDDLALGRYLRR